MQPLTFTVAVAISTTPGPSGLLALSDDRNHAIERGLDARRRRLLFRSWHRGIREMDLIMGRFADACHRTNSRDDRARRLSSG